MKNIFEKIQDYFNNTSEEQILKDWKSTENCDNVKSPTIDEFIEKTNYYYTLDDPLEHIEYINQNNLYKTIKNPNFDSDFLFI